MTIARFVVILLLVFIVPLALRVAWWTVRDDLPGSWGSADWSSAGLLPSPAAHPEAMVHVYAARVGRWRGIVAHHAWIVVKEAGAPRYTRFDKVGWGSPVRTNGWPADGRWFGNMPGLVASLEGEAAERLIPRLRAAVAEYPYRGYGDYRAWPGPNSNTFIAHVLRSAPELDAVLPPTALGKDWRPLDDWLTLTPSGTGVSVSLGGYAGLTVGWVEGVEVILFGAVAGVDLRRPALKVPFWGRFGLSGMA
jgi:hypothetical protein